MFKGITNIKYNHLNQPTEVDFGTKKTVYTYTATGGMLKTEIYQNGNLKSTTDYNGAFVYENNTLSFINIPGGRIRKDASHASHYEYNLTDHLGNVRVTFKDSSGTAVIIQEDHYYPFGMRMNGQHFSNTDLLNKYLYNGKEQQEQTGYYDYGFRQLDPQLGRWHVVDAMAENYYSQSPYNYVGNNPVSRIDVMGLWYFPVYFDGIYGGMMSGSGSSLSEGTFIGTIPGGTDGEYAQILGGVFGGGGGSSGHWENTTSWSISHDGWGPSSAGKLGVRGFFHWLINNWSLDSQKSRQWVWDNTQTGDDGGWEFPEHFTEENILEHKGDYWLIYRMTTLDRLAGNMVMTIIKTMPGAGFGAAVADNFHNTKPSLAKDVAKEIMSHAGDNGFIFGKYLSKGFTIYEIGDILYNSSKTAVEFLEKQTFNFLENKYFNDALSEQGRLWIYQKNLTSESLLNIMNASYYLLQNALISKRYNITTKSGRSNAENYIQQIQNNILISVKQLLTQ